MITLDIVITTYNSFKYLDDISFFIKDNIYIYDKIICVDDCSDESFYIQLKQRLNNIDNVRLLRNDRNLGPSASRNIGIKYSNSEYISFHDPDDFVVAGRGYYISKFLNKYKPNILFHSFTISDIKENLVFSNKFEKHNGFLYLFKCLYVTPAFTCKRKILINVGGYDQNLRYAEDIDLYIKLRKNYKFFFIKDKLVKITNRKERRLDANHQSNNFSLMRDSINKIFIKNIFNFKPTSIIFIFALLLNLLKTFWGKIFF